MTEAQLRQKVATVMKGWLGYSEANGKYKAIIDLYNTQRPLPRGYKVQYTDEWCATTVTAAGIAAGLHDIILGECSCSRMVELYKAAGRWQERDDYTPDIGDIIMYYWADGANYKTTDCTGAPNHVGIVTARSGTVLTIIEGNKGEAVATRPIQINGRYIRGYCLPDYASKAKEDDDTMTGEEIYNALNEYTSKLELPEWAKKEWEAATAAGITDGTNPMGLIPRYQAAAMAYRASKG